MSIIRKELGKITEVYMGFGGYQDAMIGINFTFELETGGVQDFEGTWSGKPNKNTKWDKSYQVKILGEAMLHLSDLLSQAKVNKIADLKGIPVEVTLKNRTLDSWRILTEVL